MARKTRSNRSIVRHPVSSALVRAATLWLVTTLGACSVSQIADLPTQVGGLPAGTPERPATAAAYPAVHDMPPARASALLTEEEQKKVEAELAAERDRQIKRGGGKKQ